MHFQQNNNYAVKKIAHALSLVFFVFQHHIGIPVDQQHLIYNHKELLDKTEIKDIPLVKGSTVKLVLDMKGGPVSARRVVTLPGYDKWFDLSDVLSHAVQDSLPVKLLVYKDCKKNIHRVMKLRADRKNMMARNQEVPTEFSRADDETHDDQWRRDNMQTSEVSVDWFFLLCVPFFICNEIILSIFSSLENGAAKI